MSGSDQTDEVARKARRMSAARRSRVTSWREFAQVGVLSWIFVLPLLLGVWGGRALEARGLLPRGTLVGIAAGLAVGGYGVWRQLQRTLKGDEG